jgi:hypothetical protein
VVFDPNQFYITSEDRVVLMFSGGGFVGQKKRAQCNRTQHKGPYPLIRHNTSMYANDHAFCASTNFRAGCNMRRLQQLANPDSAAEAVASEDSASSAQPEWRVWRDLDVRKWIDSRRDKQMGMGVLGRWEAEPKDLLVDADLVEAMCTVQGVDEITDLLRLTDVHQFITWLVCELREASAPESFAAKRKHLKSVLECPSMEKSFKGMEDFLLGRSPVKPMERGKISSCPQPAAFKRLLEFVVFSLHADFRKDAAEELSYMLFVTTPVFSPLEERLLSGDMGIRMEVRLFPFEDPDFMRRAEAMLTRVKAKGLGKFPRTVFLKNEEDIGVGIFGPDEYEKDDFLGFYLGFNDLTPDGRYVLTSIGKDAGAKYSNAEFTRFLTLSDFLELGAPGSVMNSSWNRVGQDGKPLKPNARADRKNAIEHTFRGRPVQCTPMFGKHTFQREFVNWRYNPQAGHGSSFDSFFRP